MKQFIYIIFLASLASCSSSFVAKNDVKKNADLRDIEFENETERAFMGFDLDKVWEKEVNIKVKADENNLDAFVQKAIKLGCKEVSRNQGFADGEMFVCVKVLGDYPTTLKK